MNNSIEYLAERYGITEEELNCAVPGVDEPIISKPVNPSSTNSLNGAGKYEQDLYRRLKYGFTLTHNRRVRGLRVDDTGRKFAYYHTIEGRRIKRKDRHIRGERIGRWYADGGWNGSAPRSVLLADSLKNHVQELAEGYVIDKSDSDNTAVTDGKYESISPGWEEPTLRLLPIYVSFRSPLIRVFAQVAQEYMEERDPQFNQI